MGSGHSEGHREWNVEFVVSHPFRKMREMDGAPDVDPIRVKNLFPIRMRRPRRIL